MRGFVFATVCVLGLASIVLADEVSGVLVKVEGTSLTYYKVKVFKGTGKGNLGKIDKDGDAITATAVSSVKVAYGIYSYEERKWTAGDPIEGGLGAEMFKNINQKKGLTVALVLADDGPDKGKITQVLIGGKAKKKGN